MRARREEALEFLLDFVQKSNAYRDPYLVNFREMLDNYMVVPFQPSMDAIPYIGHPSIATDPTPYRSRRIRLKDPETHQIVESLAAQALLLLFGSRDYITAAPVGSDDYEKARLLSRLLMGIFEGPGVYRTMYQAWKDSFIFGTAVLEFGWESRTRQQVTESYVMNENGEVQIVFIPQEVPYREGPMFRQTDIWDFYPDPTGTRIQQDMLFVAKRFRITKDMAREMAKARVYDGDAVEEAIGTAPRGGINTPDDERFRDANKRLPDKYGMFSGLEGWGRVPYKTSDGFSNRVVTAINGVIVRDTINPHRNGQIPFKEIVVNPMTGRFYGLSPSEVNRYLQDSADHMMMVLTEAANLMVRPQLVVGSNFGGDVNRLRRREFNDVIEARDATAVQPLIKDFNSLTIAQSELLRRKQAMRESSGSIAPLQQTLGGDRMAATTTSEIVRLASQRTELMVTLSERDDFPYIGRFIHSMLRQFLPFDADAIAHLNGEPVRVSFEDIDFDADIRFVGSRNAQSRFQKVAAYREFINVAGPNIEMIGIMPEPFIRYMQDGLEIQDAEAIVTRAIQRLSERQAMMAQQEALTRGGSPTRPSRSENFGTRAGETEMQGQRVA